MNRRDFLKDLTSPPTPSPQAERGSTESEKSPFYEVERGFRGEVRSVPTAGSPRQYTRGDVVLVLDVKAWLGCDEIGFYAIDALCPHLGCLVAPTEDGFVCPGHGSAFDHSGARLDGPACHNLRYLYVDLDEQDNLIIYRGKLTSPADRLIA